MPEVKRFSLVKPTVHTRFHIDFDWWRRISRDWRVDLRSFLCEEHQQAFANSSGDETVDYIDPDTAEVQPVDGLQHVLMAHCARQPGFITEQTTMVDSVFRTFLANGNTPLSAIELAEILGRPPEKIMSTLAGPMVYKGLRPCPGC